MGLMNSPPLAGTERGPSPSKCAHCPSESIVNGCVLIVSLFLGRVENSLKKIKKVMYLKIQNNFNGLQDLDILILIGKIYQ
jgi:hypothetical protein